MALMDSNIPSVELVKPGQIGRVHESKTLERSASFVPVIWNTGGEKENAVVELFASHKRKAMDLEGYHDALIRQDSKRIRRIDTKEFERPHSQELERTVSLTEFTPANDSTVLSNFDLEVTSFLGRLKFMLSRTSTPNIYNEPKRRSLSYSDASKKPAVSKQKKTRPLVPLTPVHDHFSQVTSVISVSKTRSLRRVFNIKSFGLLFVM